MGYLLRQAQTLNLKVYIIIIKQRVDNNMNRKCLELSDWNQTISALAINKENLSISQSKYKEDEQWNLVHCNIDILNR